MDHVEAFRADLRGSVAEARTLLESESAKDVARIASCIDLAELATEAFSKLPRMAGITGAGAPDATAETDPILQELPVGLREAILIHSLSDLFAPRA